MSQKILRCNEKRSSLYIDALTVFVQDTGVKRLPWLPTGNTGFDKGVDFIHCIKVDLVYRVGRIPPVFGRDRHQIAMYHFPVFIACPSHAIAVLHILKYSVSHLLFDLLGYRDGMKICRGLR